MALPKEFRSISGFPGSAISGLTVTCIYQLTAQAGTRVYKDALWNFMISDVVSCIL